MPRLTSLAGYPSGLDRVGGMGFAEALPVAEQGFPVSGEVAMKRSQSPNTRPNKSPRFNWSADDFAAEAAKRERQRAYNPESRQLNRRVEVESTATLVPELQDSPKTRPTPDPTAAH